MAGIFGLLMSGAGVIKDQYYNLTSLLLPGNGTNGAQNNTFLDSGTANSGSGFTITRNGNTTQGTFSPFSQTGWGNYFSGSGQYLSLADNAAYALSNGNFTAEAWVFKPASGRAMIMGQGDGASATNTSFFFQVNASDKLEGIVTISSTDYTVTASATFLLNQWVHVALVRTGPNLALYINGSKDGEITTLSTNSLNDSPSVFSVGAFGSYGSFRWSGYISNARLVKGVAVYTGNFTPPISPLTATQSAGTNISAITGTQTSLLTCQSNRFIDNSVANSGAGFTITVNGSPSVTPFSPFAPTAAYSAAAVGGSGYFDGTGDYLNGPTNTATAFNLTGDFTIEAWIYCTDIAASPTGGQGILSWADSSGWNGWQVYHINGSLKFEFLTGSTGAGAITSSTITNSQWVHIAVVRSGTSTDNIKFYVNGVSGGSASYNSSQTSSSSFIKVGADRTGSNLLRGYISNARVVNGTAVYTGSFTPPTTPLTAITNTQLLLNFTNAGVVDATAKNVLETVGTAQISNTTAKFPPTSIYLSGDGNYLTSRGSPVFSLNGDFTMEAWVYPINAGRSADAEKYGTIVSCSAPGVNSPEFSWFVRIVGSSITEYFLNINGTTVLQVTGLSVSLNAWHYFAVTRSGTGTGNLKLYIDGNLVGTSSGASTQSPTFSSSQTLMVGRNANSSTYQNWLSGYFQGVRITPGYVRTVTTVPTAPFPVQ